MGDLISIIVPVYNVENFIEETMDSVLAQTYADWELLLVEDCSNDNTVTLIRQYMERTGDSRIRLLRQPANMGAARARNRGCGRRRGAMYPIWMPMISGFRRNWRGSLPL